MHNNTHAVLHDAKRHPMTIRWSQRQIAQTLPDMQEVSTEMGELSMSFSRSSGDEHDTTVDCAGDDNDDPCCADPVDETVKLLTRHLKSKTKALKEANEDNRRLRKKVVALIHQLTDNKIQPNSDYKPGHKKRRTKK